MVFRMAVTCMPLQPHLLQSTSPPTPNSPIFHVTPCMQELARCEPVFLQPKSLWCLLEVSSHPLAGSIYPKSLKIELRCHPSLWHPYIQRVWNILVDSIPSLFFWQLSHFKLYLWGITLFGDFFSEMLKTTCKRYLKSFPEDKQVTTGSSFPISIFSLRA